MKKFTGSQILSVLKQHENGKNIADLSSKYGISSSTIYLWKRQHGRLEPNPGKRSIKELEDENSRLKRMYAEVSIERDTLKDLIGKNSGPVEIRNGKIK